MSKRVNDVAVYAQGQLVWREAASIDLPQRVMVREEAEAVVNEMENTLADSLSTAQVERFLRALATLRA